MPIDQIHGHRLRLYNVTQKTFNTVEHKHGDIWMFPKLCKALTRKSQHCQVRQNRPCSFIKERGAKVTVSDWKQGTDHWFSKYSPESLLKRQSFMMHSRTWRSNPAFSNFVNATSDADVCSTLRTTGADEPRSSWLILGERVRENAKGS